MTVAYLGHFLLHDILTTKFKIYMHNRPLNHIHHTVNVYCTNWWNLHPSIVSHCNNSSIYMHTCFPTVPQMEKEWASASWPQGLTQHIYIHTHTFSDYFIVSPLLTAFGFKSVHILLPNLMLCSTLMIHKDR